MSSHVIDFKRQMLIESKFQLQPSRSASLFQYVPSVLVDKKSAALSG